MHGGAAELGTVGRPVKPETLLDTSRIVLGICLIAICVRAADGSRGVSLSGAVRVRPATPVGLLGRLSAEQAGDQEREDKHPQPLLPGCEGCLLLFCGYCIPAR